MREILSIAEALIRHSPMRPPLLRFWRRPGRHTRRSDAKAIEYHSDVSNDFYRLWLDRNMVYSCAYFKTGEEDIHTAQEQKFDHMPQAHAEARRAPSRHRLRLGTVGPNWRASKRKHWGKSLPRISTDS